MFRASIIALIAVLLLILGGHITLTILYGAVSISLTMWGLLIASVFFFCLSILLFFLLTWTWVLILIGMATLWILIAIILFPVLLPILLPLLLIMLFVSYLRRKQTTH